MALVNGPLFSLSASGQLAKALVYSIWKGRTYVRTYATPSNPNSLGQRGTRATMAYCNERWAAMSDSDKNSWEALAAAENYSKFNAFVAAGLRAIGEAYSPSDNAAQARTAPTVQAASPTKTSGTGGTISGSCALAAATPSDVTKIAIVAKAGSQPDTPGQFLLGYLEPNGTTAVNFEYTGLDAEATYTIAAYSVSETGGVGTVQGESV